MFSVNKVTLLGNLGREPEFITFPSGDRIATLSVCTNEVWKDRVSGENREHAEWNKVEVREKGTVDFLERYAQTGTRVYVEGVLRTRKVAGKNGGDDKWFTLVDATRVSLESRLRENAQSPSRTDDQSAPQQAAPSPTRPRAVSTPKASDQRAPQRHASQEPSGFEKDDALLTPPRF